MDDPTASDVLDWKERTRKGLRVSLGGETSKKFSDAYDDKVLILYPNQGDNEKMAIDSYLRILRKLKSQSTAYDLVNGFDPRELERY